MYSIKPFKRINMSFKYIWTIEILFGPQYLKSDFCQIRLCSLFAGMFTAATNHQRGSDQSPEHRGKRKCLTFFFLLILLLKCHSKSASHLVALNVFWKCSVCCPTRNADHCAPEMDVRREWISEKWILCVYFINRENTVGGAGGGTGFECSVKECWVPKKSKKNQVFVLQTGHVKSFS